MPARGAAVRLAALTARHPRRTLLLVGLLLAFAAWRATRLELRTALIDLLPADDPAVVALAQLERRLLPLSSMVVIARSPSPAANRRLVDELAPRLRALRSPLVADVSAGVFEERAFARANRLLYASVDDLEQAVARLEQQLLRRASPLYVDLEDDDGASFAAQRRRLERQAAKLGAKLPDGYFASPDRRSYAIVLWLRGSMVHGGPPTELIAQVERLLRELRPARFHPQMKLGLTGPVVAAADERQALQQDLVLATSVAVGLVCLVLLLYFGGLGAVPLATLPALVAVTCALAFAQLAFGHLNSSTAFLGSIIVGNGINSAIIMLARYEEERRAGHAPAAAAGRSVAATWRATGIAALCAAVAYGSLALTSFRGFNQFGYIGAVGMILSWLLTLVMLPALWSLVDRRRDVGRRRSGRVLARLEPAAALLVRHARPILALGVLATVLALIPLPRYLRDPFEYDFRKLGHQNKSIEAARLGDEVGVIFGRRLAPGFIIAPSAAAAETVRQALWRADRPHRVLGEVRTLGDLLPGDAAQQRSKLELLGRIRTLIDKNLPRLSGARRAELAALRPPDDLRVVRPEDLPPSARRLFSERDGTIGRVVLYYPRRDISVWDGRTQLALATVVQELRLPDGQVVRSSGAAVVFAAMLHAIGRDGPFVTAAALLGVVAIVVLLTRRRGGAPLIVLTLIAGVLWVVGGAAAADVRVNFLNFVALPITFGIGVDYAINLRLRYGLEGPQRLPRAVAQTGSAVALCSLTTIIGYGALLTADSAALRSFGALAILGEFGCLAATLLVLPAYLAWRAPAPAPQRRKTVALQDQPDSGASG